MAVVAINGLGRIGRATLKVLAGIDEVRVAAVNDLIPIDNLAYLMRYDTVYGRYGKPVSVDGDTLTIDGQPIRVFSCRDPGELPWHDLGVELVFECTGAFRHQDELAKHLAAGARFVLLSAPARTETITTVVHGVNQHSAGDQIISCASCTTNCITPGRRNPASQSRFGASHDDDGTRLHRRPAHRRRCQQRSPPRTCRRRQHRADVRRCCAGDHQSVARPARPLRRHCDAIRVPVPVGSIADITLVPDRPTSAAEINQILREEAATDRYRGILGVSDDPMVSADIIGDPHACVVDAAMTQVVDGTLAKVMAWYDNEWGFTHQMVREALSLLGVKAEV
ncbi:MAG TPA: glyceraldehyde 3-phosphate dehydrogenase NAD-binding domain-containing protein [Mycobacterium sp.]|nr:glyceraldehyde 3-phosphate dehydrogenase NAD-binding domain-containing protein [Mycobacterium sp.]